MKRKTYWIAVHPVDGSRLATDGKWYHTVDPTRVKLYKSNVWAMKASERAGRGHKLTGETLQTVAKSIAIFEGETLDASGKIYGENGRIRAIAG